MKKVLLTLALVAMFSSSAFAWGHQGNHGNHWGNHGNHSGNHWNEEHRRNHWSGNHGSEEGHNGHWFGEHRFGFGHNNHDQAPNNAQPSAPLSEAAAQAAVQDFINQANLKGYSITGVTTDVNYGVNIVSARDSGGNDMVFYVNPYGQVKGPVLNNQ
jgi:hypothetical protein